MAARKPKRTFRIRVRNVRDPKRKDALARKIWAILEPNRPIEQFLGEDPKPDYPPAPHRADGE